MAKVNNDSWLIDSATSSHITNRCKNLTEFSPLQKTVKEVEGTDVPVLGKGTVALSSRVNRRTQTLILKDILYVPQAPNNLFSVPCLNKTGGHAKMGSSTTELYDKQKNLIAIGHKVERMYLLDRETLHREHGNVIKETFKSWEDWHRKFGHIGVSRLQHTKKGRLVDGFEMPKDEPTFDCAACTKAKQTQNLFPRQTVARMTKPGELTHTDLWEACETGIHGVKYFISFINNCSRCVAIKCLETKNQAAEKIKNYVAYLERQYDMKPK